MARIKLLGKLKIEEAVMKQRSRVQWLELGDQNIAYFNGALKIRQNIISYASIQIKGKSWKI